MKLIATLALLTLCGCSQVNYTGTPAPTGTPFLAITTNTPNVVAGGSVQLRANAVWPDGKLTQVAGGTWTGQGMVENGLYTASDSPLLDAVTVMLDGATSPPALVTVYQPGTAQDAGQWLAGVDAVAPTYGCSGTVKQYESETITEAIQRFGETADDGDCLVLYPQSVGAVYSVAVGGSVDGKTLTYISDVQAPRIWTGADVNEQ